jgi:hypothetical protein
MPRYRRGVEGGSSPLGMTAGGRRGVVPPGHQDADRRGVEGGSSPLGINAERRTQNARNVAPANAMGTSAPPAKSRDPRATVPAGGRRGVVPPGHQRRGVLPTPGPWAVPAGGRRGVVPPGHNRRGVEGGSSPLGMTGGGSKGGRPPWASDAERRTQNARNVAPANASTSAPPASHANDVSHSTGGGSKGGRPPWA